MAGARGYQNYRGRTPLWKKLLAAVLVLYALSWRLSVQWYGKYKK